MKRKLILTAIIIFTGVLPISCGDDDDDSSGSEPADNDANDDSDDDTSSDDDLNDDANDDIDDDLNDDLDDDVNDDTASPDDDDIPPEPDYDMEFEGFGASATGGNQEGGVTQTVTSFVDDGPGTLRQILRDADGPTVVEFAADGIIDALTVLDLPSDITIDARGRDITLTQNGFRIDGQSNIVIMNIAFVDISGQTGDCIQIINESRDIVIFHCLFDSAGLMPFVEDVPDEQISVVWGSGDITISWCRFMNHDKVLLFGNGDAPQELDRNIRVTFHHNIFENTGRRHPFLRWGQVDMYNNIIRGWRRYLYFPYGTRSQAQGEILCESNWYEQDTPIYFVGSYFVEDGRIRHVDNVTTGAWIMMLENKPDLVFERPYEANIHKLDDAWLEMMEAHTGNTMPIFE